MFARLHVSACMGVLSCVSLSVIRACVSKCFRVCTRFHAHVVCGRVCTPEQGVIQRKLS